MGATRIAPPHPFELLIGLFIVPCPPTEGTQTSITGGPPDTHFCLLSQPSKFGMPIGASRRALRVEPIQIRLPNRGYAGLLLGLTVLQGVEQVFNRPGALPWGCFPLVTQIRLWVRHVNQAEQTSRACFQSLWSCVAERPSLPQICAYLLHDHKSRTPSSSALLSATLMPSVSIVSSHRLNANMSPRCALPSALTHTTPGPCAFCPIGCLTGAWSTQPWSVGISKFTSSLLNPRVL